MYSNKVDTELDQRCIDVLHRQVTHIIVLLVEFLKTNVQEKKESHANI